MPYLPDIDIGAIGDDPKKQLESVVKQVNEAFRLISNEDRTKIVKDDTGTQRLLTGFQQDGFDNGNVGVKMSQTGVDVASASDDQLIFSTDFSTFKIVTSDVVTITPPGVEGGYVEVEVPHGLDVPPVVIAYTDNSGQQALPILNPGSDGIILYKIGFYTDDTNVYFFWEDITQASFLPLPIRYYILRETAE